MFCVYYEYFFGVIAYSAAAGTETSPNVDASKFLPSRAKSLHRITYCGFRPTVVMRIKVFRHLQDHLSRTCSDFRIAWPANRCFDSSSTQKLTFCKPSGIKNLVVTCSYRGASRMNFQSLDAPVLHQSIKGYLRRVVMVFVLLRSFLTP